jgi:hypothetical protein
MTQHECNDQDHRDGGDRDRFEQVFATVIRSMPTSETRTQASMTIPLSNTRSRTSTRLVPPAALSTGMSYSNWFDRPAPPGLAGEVH